MTSVFDYILNIGGNKGHCKEHHIDVAYYIIEKICLEISVRFPTFVRQTRQVCRVTA